MSFSADRNSSHNPRSVGSELNPLRGGHWREVKPEELIRRNVSRKTSSSSQRHQADPSQQPAAVCGPGEVASAAPTEPSGTSLKESVTPPASNRSQPKVVRLERRQELEHHLKSSPTNLDAFMELGRIYRAEDRPADARRVFQQALQVFPEEMQLLWEHEEAVLARSLQQLREVTDVAKRLDTAESDRELKRCQNDWACRRMDVCRARLGRDPSLAHLRVVLAEAMYDAGLYEGAIEELKMVLDQDDFSPTAYLIQGRCLLEMGKDVEAMASLRAASLRRSVVAPVRTRVAALRLLCETADRLGVTLTLAQYRQHLERAEQELAELAHRGHSGTPNVAAANKSDA